MKNMIQIKGISIGEGKPKIVVPIVGKTKSAILESAVSFEHEKNDMVEWRIDFYEDALNVEKVLDTLEAIREIIPKTPLIATFRTQNEGGEKAITTTEYCDLNKALAASGHVDIVDVELFSGDEVVREIINYCHEHRVFAVASNHEFTLTPPKSVLIERLCKMESLGADLLKIAVMPTCTEDVLTLLDATQEMYKNHTKCPLVTMSMSPLGVMSRMAGEIFGSALTFGAVGQVSAPGQISVEKLETVLQIIHDAI
ncbi:type I 3-dehydroquinate dehydratase [Fusibacter ferrireducens]|uniref:3-dehydroquinate dehydratase n=1 Tax=Fusibacter ferrireducens TaxID=2785058 RepID=A0ABR9ZWC2_9FIRM|nr:type I 3-dehydroquinate dehydratase [Fusibacter ferrireducens]MBF4694276.1 type I 3-dehydroquinate dehydratase [Fusibacter ferrireducens]